MNTHPITPDAEERLELFLTKHMADPAARYARDHITELEHQIQGLQDDLDAAKREARLGTERVKRVLGLVSEYCDWDRGGPEGVSSQTAKLVTGTLLDEIARELR